MRLPAFQINLVSVFKFIGKEVIAEGKDVIISIKPKKII